MTIRPFAVLAVLGFATAAQAHDYKAGDLTVLHPFAIETAARATTGAGYFEIRNDGDTADTLIAVEADFPKVALHTSVEADGMMTMQPLERIEIAPGDTVTLAPGEGGHVMFMGLEAPFEIGESFDATLVFEKAGEIAVEFNVEPRPDPSAAGMDHDEMDHDDMNHGEMDHDTAE
ncbi:copper chaperone PCu(A)C [Limimaricola hongkongensis]|uniref:Copper metallochaperone n=1 Tax=Limimaricola hongkongensis DSM 17492 TaxID=1122180 RepID=A0A017HEX9_9RHOB|nr:copper chaperone PCu(A)C [Limimaricola hongkongensis]EYD72354.1 Copper metallochaperone [Limimaricola hongkongensis DSM 17492]